MHSSIVNRRMKGVMSSKRHALLSDTKSRIIASAIKLFAQNGYAGTSTKAICDAAGADIAAVHYHFKSKEGLYRHIIEQFAANNLDKLCQILRPPKTQDEFLVRLETFLQVGIDNMMQQPELSEMILRDIGLMTDLCEGVFKNTFLKLHEALVSFFVSAKASRLIRPEIDPPLAALSFYSQMLFLSHGAGLIKFLQNADITDAGFRERWLAHIMRSVRLVLLTK